MGPVVGCVTMERLRLSTTATAPERQLSDCFADPASLRSPTGGPSGLFFDLTYRFTLTPAELPRERRQWHVATRMYEYRLLDHHHTELLVYHWWQPGPDFAGPDNAHLHVSATLSPQVNALNRREIDLDKLHPVTGPVSLAAIVRMLIAEFHVAPRRGDWRDMLDRAEETLGPA